MMAALSGPVPAMMKNMAMASDGSIRACGPKKQTSAKGTVSADDQAETR